MATYLMNANLSTEVDTDKFLTELKEFCNTKGVELDVSAFVKTSYIEDKIHLVRPVTCISCVHYNNYYCEHYEKLMNPNEAWDGTCECVNFYTVSSETIYIYNKQEDKSWLVKNNSDKTENGYIPLDEISTEQIVKDAAVWIKGIEDILSEEGFVRNHWELREDA